MQVTTNYQIKYGQIARIKKDFLYNVFIGKDNFYEDCIWFDVFISRKTSKTRDFKSDYTKQYFLTNGKNQDVLKEIIEVIKNYLKIHKPKYIALSAFGEDNWKKRMNFYLKILSRLGYSAFDHYHRVAFPGVLLMTHTEDCKKIFIGADFDEEYEDFYFYTKDGEKSFINWE